jgi:hypothetical protein
LPAIHRRIPSFVIAAALACTSSVLAQASWQLAFPAQSPQPAPNWRMAFDEANGTALLMYPDSGQPQDSFWRWNGSNWDQPNAVTPPHRYGAYLTYDVARQKVVLYGGSSSSTGSFLQDLWEWNGTSWTQRSVASFPAPRSDAGFTFDRARNVAVLFGGVLANQARSDETWEWNGTAWTLAAAAIRPAPRRLPMLAFDPTTRRVLMHGGDGFTETWTWNGAVWQQHFASSPPFLRQGAVMVSDLARSRVVLYGGNTYDFMTWEWDGAQWHAAAIASPGPLTQHSGTYDTQRREVVVFGGASPGWGIFSNLWRYRTDNAATATSFGAGCAGSAGTPVLANAPYTLPWLGDTMRTRVNTVPTSLGALFVSSFTPATPTSLAPFGMPGCDLLVTPDALEFRSANAGAAEWTLSIPNTTALVGMPIHQQALPLDPTANALGVVASNGLVMVPGIR